MREALSILVDFYIIKSMVKFCVLLESSVIIFLLKQRAKKQ